MKLQDMKPLDIKEHDNYEAGSDATNV